MSESQKKNAPPPATDLPSSEAEWRSRLSPDAYRVLRERATDAPFSGRYTHPGAAGRFRCAGCGAELFDDETQYDSGSGWPSFTEPVDPEQVELREDRDHHMVRVEVACARCGGHLGHVFPDGPGPAGERWCINSTSLELDSRSPDTTD